MAVDASTGKTLVRVNPKYYRPAEVDLLIGDASKAKEKLGWQAKTTFKDLVRLMVDADMVSAEQEAHVSSYNNSHVNAGARLRKGRV